MLARLFAAPVASALPLPLRGQKFGTIMKIAQTSSLNIGFEQNV
jgi:hypothetical protein